MSTQHATGADVIKRVRLSKRKPAKLNGKDKDEHLQTLLAADEANRKMLAHQAQTEVFLAAIGMASPRRKPRLRPRTSNDTASQHDIDCYVERINATWQSAVESIIKTGKLLVEAQDKLGYGNWVRMFDGKKLRFGLRTAERLMKIARHPVLSDPTHGSSLPPSWRSLYELTKIFPPSLEDMLADGTINPDIERGTIEHLCRGERPTPWHKRVRGRDADGRRSKEVTDLDRMESILNQALGVMLKNPDPREFIAKIPVDRLTDPTIRTRLDGAQAMPAWLFMSQWLQGFQHACDQAREKDTRLVVLEAAE
jgi:hypothetical protein